MGGWLVLTSLHQKHRGMQCGDCNSSNHIQVQLPDDCSLIEANKGTRFLEPVVIAFVLEYSKPSTIDPQQN